MEKICAQASYVSRVLTGSALHDICRLHARLFNAEHGSRIISHQHCLAPDGDHILIFNTPEISGRKACAIHNQLGRVVAMMHVDCL